MFFRKRSSSIFIIKEGIRSCINGGHCCELAGRCSCAWSDSFAWDEKGYPEGVLFGCCVEVELGNVRVGQVDDFVELEGNEEGSIVSLAV